MKELSEKSGVSVFTIFTWEKRGRWSPRPSTRRKLAKALNLDPATLPIDTAKAGA